MMEKLRVWLWILRKYPIYKYRCWQTRGEQSRLNIATSLESVQQIVDRACSVARFGDGELQMISHYLNHGDSSNFGVDTFQNYNPNLGKRLYEILSRQEPLDNLMLCLPYQLKDSSISDTYAQLFWDREWLSRRDFLVQYCLDKPYGDATFTRFYMGRRDIADYPRYITQLRKIWAGRKLLIVEGELSRLGVGNDLFDCAASVQRIICPKTNAYARYDEILDTTQRLADKDTLLILALGHTATVLAYDLCKLGHQALDLGHIDVEYEWYRMGAKTKVAIPNKYVNEVASGRIQAPSATDKTYQDEIISRIL